MKTSIDLPDELYRQVKAKSALEGKTVREVATSLFAAYAAGETAPRADDDAMGAAALAGRLGLRGADAVYLAHAITVGTALVTLDDELLVRGAAVADVWTPAAWLARHSP